MVKDKKSGVVRKAFGSALNGIGNGVFNLFKKNPNVTPVLEREPHKEREYSESENPRIIDNIKYDRVYDRELRDLNRRLRWLMDDASEDPNVEQEILTLKARINDIKSMNKNEFKEYLKSIGKSIDGGRRSRRRRRTGRRRTGRRRR
jgi:hypothetical protein